MVHFTRSILSNGLRVLVHEDRNTPLVAVNVLYFVGSRDERPDKTGFAHLFEHLMFAGSRNAPDFDEPMQRAGGENNAYTTNDYTTFYEIVPAENIETALWLESDRMLALNIHKKALDVQRRVVVEEFKESCLNEPYGDAWHHLSDLMFKVHPYRWPVIGLKPEHLENAAIEDVREFYQHWYTPNNAVLTIAGNIRTEAVLPLVEKWFGNIPAGPAPDRQLPPEPPQTALQQRTVRADVPVPAVYLTFRTPPRLHPDFYAVDLLSDVLAQGQSSRLYRRLVKEKRLFSGIDAYVTANLDPGLLIIEGKPADGVPPEEALAAVWVELDGLKSQPIDARELAKIQHRLESTIVFSETSVLNKAQNLAFYEILKNAEWMNDEVAVYLAVTPDDLLRTAQELFRPENAAVLTYMPQQQEPGK
ncbi:MAG: insulinase family protein [Saprospirales bacterium]|jgi:zinc protease|nr:insulinase family protein [Saprospirales bacterium]MBK8920353.1 insulinase family protein [Saprospirales bacterium]